MTNTTHRRRSTIAFGNYNNYNYTSKIDLISSNIESGLHSLHENNRYFDFLYQDNSSNILFVIFSGKMDREYQQYPLIDQPDFVPLDKVSWLSFADVGNSPPEELETTWHIGTRRFPTVELSAQIIRNLHKRHKFELIVLFGISEGGYAALNMARHIPGSVALVVNSVTHPMQDQSNFQAFLDRGHKGSLRASSGDLSMVDAYRRPTGSRLVYIQNLRDEPAKHRDYVSFLDSNINPVVEVLGAWDQTTGLPPEWTYASTLAILSNGRRSADELFDLKINSEIGNRLKYDDSVLDHLIGNHLKFREDDIKVAEGLLLNRLCLPGRPVHELGDDIDWGANPFQDNNWRFNFHSLRWLDPLRRAYLSTKRAKYLTKYQQVLHSWYRFHILDFGHTPYSWYDMACGTRVKILVAALQVLPNEAWLNHLLYRHGEHLFQDFFLSRKGNHTLHAMTGLLICGHYFRNEIWIERAINKIESLFNDCVDSEGVDYEGALQYQINNYVWYSEARSHIIIATGREPNFHMRLTSMIEFLVMAINTAGKYVQYGESDRTLPRIHFDHSELKWASSRGELGQSPSRMYASYSAGYTFGRSGWSRDDFDDGIFYSLRHGPSIYATPHGQRDAGTITLTRGASEYLFESGRFRYDDSKESTYLNSAQAHSTADLPNSHLFDEIPTELIMSFTNDSMDWTVIGKTAPGVAGWKRSVLHLREHRCLVVVDDFDSPPQDQAELYWQFSENSEVSIENQSMKVIDPSSDYSLRFDVHASSDLDVQTFSGSEVPYLGWRSVEHGKIFPSPLMRWRVSGESSRVVTLLSFEHQSAVSEYAQERLQNYETGQDRSDTFTVRLPDSAIRVKLPGLGKQLKVLPELVVVG